MNIESGKITVFQESPGQPIRLTPPFNKGALFKSCRSYAFTGVSPDVAVGHPDSIFGRAAPPFRGDRRKYVSVPEQ